MATFLGAGRATAQGPAGNGAAEAAGGGSGSHSYSPTKWFGKKDSKSAAAGNISVEELDKKLKALRTEYPQLSQAMTMAESPNPHPSYLRVHGYYRTNGVEVAPAVPSVLPQPPKKEEVKPVTPQRIKVGGNVQSARLVRQPRPVYPPLAKQARISGVVKLGAIISKDGTIQHLEVISGHPLLVPAALEAVKQWVYQPTLLNGEPVEVQTQIDVNFTLSQ